MGDNQQGVKPYYLTTIGAITANSHDLQYYNLGKSLFAILQRRINSLECERKQPRCRSTIAHSILLLYRPIFY